MREDFELCVSALFHLLFSTSHASLQCCILHIMHLIIPWMERNILLWEWTTFLPQIAWLETCQIREKYIMTFHWFCYCPVEKSYKGRTSKMFPTTNQSGGSARQIWKNSLAKLIWSSNIFPMVIKILTSADKPPLNTKVRTKSPYFWSCELAFYLLC